MRCRLLAFALATALATAANADAPNFGHFQCVENPDWFALFFKTPVGATPGTWTFTFYVRLPYKGHLIHFQVDSKEPSCPETVRYSFTPPNQPNTTLSLEAEIQVIRWGDGLRVTLTETKREQLGGDPSQPDQKESRDFVFWLNDRF